MKKKSLLKTALLIVYMAGQSALGQSIGTLYNTDATGMNSIIRQIPGYPGRYITATSHSSPSSALENHFIYTDFTYLYDVKVAEGLFIKDFEIVDRLVFFCGYNLSNSGFLGWFNIDSLFFNGVGVHVDATLSSLGLLSLDDIEVYKDAGNRIHIAGFGPDNLVPGSMSYLAFEAKGDLATGMQYRVQKLLQIAMYADIVDIAVTDNYVVYLGRMKSQECLQHFCMGVSLQPFPKFGMFDNPPFYLHYFETVTYSMPGTVMSDNEDPVKITLPKIVFQSGDIVAVCSHRRDFSSIPPCIFPYNSLVYSNTYLALRRFDLSPLLINNPIVMISADGVKLNNNGVNSIDGFEYDPVSKTYVVLHSHETPSYLKEYAVACLDYSSGYAPAYVQSDYQVTYNTYSYWEPHGLCLNGNSAYVVCGHKYNPPLYDLMFWSNQFNNPGSCNRLQFNKTTNFPRIDPKVEKNEQMPTTWSNLYFQYIDQYSIHVRPALILCTRSSSNNDDTAIENNNHQ